MTLVLCVYRIENGNANDTLCANGQSINSRKSFGQRRITHNHVENGKLRITQNRIGIVEWDSTGDVRAIE